MDLTKMEWNRINSGDDPAEIFQSKENNRIVSILPAGDGLYHMFLENTIQINDIKKMMHINYEQVINELGFNPWTKY